jgi:hypothetical protein
VKSLPFALALVLSQCGKSTPSSVSAAAASGSSSADARAAAAGDAGEPIDPREADAWERAKEGEDEDRMRLADRVGCQGLREHAQEPALRPTALRSMAFCPDFSELPWLANVAATGGDEEAALALDAILEQAARPRRATDPEDADELSVGCRALLALSRSAERPRPRRVKAIDALRMLADRGCVKRADVPTGLDAKEPPDAATVLP